MTDTYTITFAGRTTGEYELAQVKHSLAALFKMNATQVEALFSGKPVVIKRHIDKTTAQKYYAAFKKAGAVCVISSDNTSAAKQTAQPAAQSAPVATTSAPPGRRYGRDVVDLPLPDDVSDYSLAQAGETLPHLPAAAAASVPDTSGLQLADEAEDLAPKREIAEPNIDIRGIGLVNDD